MLGKKVVSLGLLLAAVVAGCGTAPAKGTAEDSGGPLSDVVVEHVRTNWLTNPMGIGDSEPLLSWRLGSHGEGVRQTAYQVAAASSPERLAARSTRLWDTTKVASADPMARWRGPALASRQRVYLSVRVWDQDGKPSAWSAPVWFEMGLLRPQDWAARWIGAPAAQQTAPPSPLADAAWIWFPGDNATKQAPAAPRWFRLPFELPAAAKVKDARVRLGANDSSEVFINGKSVGSARMGEMAPDVDVTRFIKPGKNMLGLAAVNTGGPAGVLATLDLTLADGSKFKVRTGDDGWLAARKVPPNWNVAGAASDGFAPAETLAKFGAPPFEGMPRLPAIAPPAPQFSKSFVLRKPAKRARAYISGLGYYELYINGRRVGDQVLDPGYTDYGKRVQYVVHDVADLLTSDANVIGVVLGNGFFNQHAADVWGFHKAHWRAPPRLLLQVEIDAEDGSRTVIASDASWKVSVGPTRFDGIRNGEHYDARLAEPKWARPGYTPAESTRAQVVEAPAGKLVAREHPPIRVTQTLAARSVKQIGPETFLYDFGQNIAGWARLRARAPAGATVTLRFGEKLGSDGRLDRQPLEGLLRQGEFEVDRYTFRGDDEETWEPRFTYHGFQYVEATGVAQAPSLEARAINTDFASVGSLYTSDALVNQIHAATRWAYEGNFQGIPTDCPHREKNGWTGDAHLAVDMGLFNYDNVAGYNKWIDDLLDAQAKQGNLPGIVPSPGWGYDTKWSGPSWEIALFIVPWSVYTFTGDVRVLEKVFMPQQRYLEYLQKVANGHIVDVGLGDWLPWKTKTPVAVTSTAHYLMAARLAARAAKVLGKGPQHTRWTKVADDIFAAFQTRFVDAQSGRVAGDEQTSLALAITHELVPHELEAKVADRLIARLRETDFHPDTGVIGAKAVLRALAKTGHADVAYKVASQTTPPSWGHWVRQGGTTLWENWQGDASRNHIFFGDIDAWYFEVLGGIQPDPEQPGFAHVRLAPQLLAGLDHVEAKVVTVRGPLESTWRREGEGTRFVFVVPPNARATVTLPASESRQLLTGNKQPLPPNIAVKPSATAGHMDLAVPAGRHEFLVVGPQ